MRKLLSVTCILSLVFSLVSPAFAESPAIGTEKQTSWGVLKSRYGQKDEIVSRRTLVEKAVLSDPYLSNPLIGLIQKMGPPDQRESGFAPALGYVAVGFTSGNPFVCFVNGNYHRTNTYLLDDNYSLEGASGFRIKSIQDDGETKKIILEPYSPSFDRTDLHTEGIMDELQAAACAALASAITAHIASKAGTGGGLIGVGLIAFVWGVLYAECRTGFIERGIGAIVEWTVDNPPYGPGHPPRAPKGER